MIACRQARESVDIPFLNVVLSLFVVLHCQRARRHPLRLCRHSPRENTQGLRHVTQHLRACLHSKMKCSHPLKLYAQLSARFCQPKIVGAQPIKIRGDVMRFTLQLLRIPSLLLIILSDHLAIIC